MNALTGVITGALLAFSQSNAQPTVRWSGADEYLSRALGLSAAELSAISRGEPVAKQLAVGQENDVAMIAAVDVMVPRSYFVERQRDFPRAIHATSQRAAQLFSRPAREADVSLLQVTDEEVGQIAKCRPNACDFKLPGEDMTAVRNLSAGPNATSRVTAYARQRIVAFVNDYRSRGDSALVVYADREPVRASDAFDAMFRDWTPVHDGLPSANQLVSNRSGEGVAGVDDAIFWTIDQITAVRPTLRILHAQLYSPPEFAAASAVVRRQLYANHYLEAGVELLIGVQRPSGTAVTLIALRRYRFDNLPAGPLNLRRRVSAGLQANMLSELRRLKREYESELPAKGEEQRHIGAGAEQ
jgi:hypothetical protein